VGGDTAYRSKKNEAAMASRLHGRRRIEDCCI